MKRWFSITASAVALGLGAGLAGCNKTADEGPPCAKVVDHMLDIMKSTAGGHGGMNLGSRQPMIETCERRHMSKATRTCLVSSKDITGLANCSHTTAPPPRGSGELAAPRPLGAPPLSPPVAAPVPSGSGTPPP